MIEDGSNQQMLGTASPPEICSVGRDEMTEEGIQKKRSMKVPPRVALVVLLLATIAAYLNAFSFDTLVRHPEEIIKFLPGVVLFGWAGMPGNLLHNLGVPDSFMTIHASPVRFVICWGILIAYWIIMASLVTLSLTKRHVLLLAAFVILVLVSGHGCAVNIRGM